jgi:tRNA(Ile2) C34 agmatinyltransferase TiaS
MNGCPACGGELALLGQLGSLVHFRCTACGLDSNGLTREEALANLEQDTKAYRWNAATGRAIQQGIMEAKGDGNT